MRERLTGAKNLRRRPGIFNTDERFFVRFAPRNDKVSRYLRSSSVTIIPLTEIKSKSLLSRAVFSEEPNYMVLFVTAVCNARCPMCFYWEEIESANARLELRLEEFEKISQKLNHLHYLSIGGGEPFIR
ncbi:hypothetical protein GWN42_22410, partial [candidate division KSB1 bacterium]|nr:hypothetical protein [candidate division KSB1 bacterium]